MMSEAALVVEHLIERLTHLWPESAPHRLLIACSGGPDSVALVHLCHQAGNSFFEQIAIAHFNHRLRGEEAEEDQRFVINLAHRIGVPCFSGQWHPLRRESLPHHDRNLQAAARRARYDFLLQVAREEGYPVIATAHQREDQIETILLNLERGGGDGAWLGIRDRIRMQEIWILRPLLETPKLSLIGYLELGKHLYRIDTSNLTGKYRRNRLRHEIQDKGMTEKEILELLEKRQKRIEEEQYWLQVLDGKRKEFFTGPESLVLPRAFLHSLPEKGRFFCLRKLLGELVAKGEGWYPVRRAPLCVLFGWLDAGKQGTLYLPGGICAELQERTLRLSKPAAS